jgi:adhesin transport system outer membrane protein
LSKQASVNLPSVNFQFNSAELSADAKARVAQIASILNRTAPANRISIEGHASRDEANQDQLSRRRAEIVSEALVNLGITSNLITVRGLGSRSPVASNETEAGRRQNRRVAVIVEN